MSQSCHTPVYRRTTRFSKAGKDRFCVKCARISHGSGGLWTRFDIRMMILNLFKHIFRSAADRANPVFRQFVKRCAGRDIAVGIALFWIVDVTTDFAFPPLHVWSPVLTSPVLPLGILCPSSRHCERTKRRRSRCEGLALGNLKSSLVLLGTRLRSFHSLAMT